METAPTDSALLARYARASDEAAFAELVRRHLGPVYHAACRQTGGQTHLAEEVAQVVFTRLARKADVLVGHQALAGWLHTATRHVASETLRAERRRRAREREVAAMEENPVGGESSGAGWEALRPVIDEALGALDERDREAVLLRYFAGLSHAAVGARLAVSENAARMRVERALEKLQVQLARRGVTSTAAALGGCLAGQAGAAVPAGLAASVTSAALAGAAAGAAAILSVMSTTKIILATGGTAVLCALLGTAGWRTLAAREAVADAESARAETAALTARHEAAARGAEAAGRAAAELRAQLAVAQAERTGAPVAPVAAGTGTPARDPAWDPVREGEALMTRHPELRTAVRERADAITAFTYGPMLRALGLPPEREEAFRFLMREQGGISAPSGPRGESIAMRPGTGVEGAAFEDRLREILGDEGMRQRMDAVLRSDARRVAAQVAAELAFSEAALSGEQGRQLVELMAGTLRSPGVGQRIQIAWDEVMTRAPGVLTPSQLEALAAVRVADQRRQTGARTVGSAGGPVR